MLSLYARIRRLQVIANFLTYGHLKECNLFVGDNQHIFKTALCLASTICITAIGSKIMACYQFYVSAKFIPLRFHSIHSITNSFHYLCLFVSHLV